MSLKLPTSSLDAGGYMVLLRVLFGCVCVWLLDTHMQQLYKVDHRNMFEITSFCTWDSQDFKGIPSVVRPRFDPIIGVRWLIWIPFSAEKNRSAFSGPVTQYRVKEKLSREACLDLLLNFIWKSSGGWQGQTQIRFLWNTSRYTWIEGGQLSYGVLLLGAFHWRTSYAEQFWHVPRLAAPCRIGPLRRTNR